MILRVIDTYGEPRVVLHLTAAQAARIADGLARHTNEEAR